jgi:hypothetical protein
MTTVTPDNLTELGTSNRLYDISELAHELFHYLPNRQKYLEKFESRQSEYETRIRSSRLVNYYHDTIEFYASTISELDFGASNFIRLITNIDGLENDLTTFLNYVDMMAMVYGGAWIDISKPEKLYLVTEKAIQQTNKNKVIYLDYTGNRVIVDSKYLVSYWFDRGIVEPGKLRFTPLFRDVITTNLELFIANSEYNALVRLYGNPVLVRVDNNGLNLNAGQTKSSIDFREKNRVVDLNVGGELYFLGLTEVNAAVLRERIATLTEWLETQKQFLVPLENGANRSATEVNAITHHNKLLINKLVIRKNNNIETVLRNWLTLHYPQYANEATQIKVAEEEKVSQPIEETVNLEVERENNATETN